MDNNVMERPYDERGKIPAQVLQAAKDIGAKAGDGLARAAEMTEKNVKRYPLAAVGIALGSGVLIGVCGAILLRRHPPTFLRDRFDELELGDRVSRMFKKLF